ncbi:MAG: hypothetical protein KME13_23360 [Myxacorys californica WJT36-NPBG1]|jgi:hypothetical protein|nr:hypothetical protein [Myxacorys californica WJT36-NPBG1]
MSNEISLPPGIQINLYGTRRDRELLHRAARARGISASALVMQWVRSLEVEDRRSVETS